MKIEFDYPLNVAPGVQVTGTDINSVTLVGDGVEVVTSSDELGSYHIPFFGSSEPSVLSQEETELLGRAFAIILAKTKIAAQANHPKET